MPLGPRHLLAPLMLVLLPLAGCGDDGPVRLEVTVQGWSGWSREQPAPVVTTHELDERETFTVDLVGYDDVVVTVVQVDGDEVALETSRPMAAEGEDGGFDVADPRTAFSLERGGSVGFGTPTLDAGSTITVAER